MASDSRMNLELEPDQEPPVKRKKTNAERSKEYKNRQKEKDPQYFNKEKKRIATYRAARKNEQSQEEKLALRKKEKERKREYRRKKRQTVLQQDIHSLQDTAAGMNTGDILTPYSRPQTLGKAIQRLVRKLPPSPRKKKAVITGVAERIGIKLEGKMNVSINEHPHQGPCLSHETIRSVEDFYTCPDVVYTMPGMKDEITLWIDGKKVKERKYYLTVFLKEAFRMYIELHPDNKIGFSKFCSLRPKNVLLLHETPSDQCKCRIHENFILKLKGLGIQYDSINRFWDSVLCDTIMNSKCWQSACNDCANAKKLMVSIDPATTVTWRGWEMSDRETEDGKTQKKLKSVLHEGFVAELRELVEADFQDTVRHINVKRIQAKQFQDDQANPTVRNLQMDFAMNYSSEYQDEVQSALWSQASVTLFTAAVMYNGSCKTFIVCSDTKDKTKDTVAVFVDHLYKDYIIPEDCPATEEIIWTDGPSSEFKNRYMMRLLQILSQKYGRKFSWKYFATSHGKGIVDGIGGRAKSLVRAEVLSKKADRTVVQTSEDFARTAAKLMDKTTVIHISQKEIKTSISQMAPWDDVTAIPGIQKIHVAHCLTSGQLQLYVNALQEQAAFTVGADQNDTEAPPIETDSLTPSIGSPSSSDINVGDWCVIIYDNEQYPGEVTDIRSGEFEVSVMHRVGKYFKWPLQADRIFYRHSSLVRKLKGPPVMATRMGRNILSKFLDFE